MSRVAGIDGAPGGWAVAIATFDGLFWEVDIRFETSLSDIVAGVRSGSIDAAAIDMPIGLLNAHPRPADVAARALLGPRRSSVFPTPLRVTLDAADYDDACERSRAECGKALSKQAFNLIPKIAELDALIEPADQDRIVEAHPELAFARLVGDGFAGRRLESETTDLTPIDLTPLEAAKATPEGRQLRIDHITDTFGSLPDHSGVPITDALDAIANVATAAHVAAGTEERLGGDPDPTGKRCEIVF